MPHGLGHGDLDTDTEDFLAEQALPDPILVRMHDDRVVVVDEDRTKRWIDVIALDVSSDVEDVERAGPGRHKIAARELLWRLRKRVAGPEDDAAPCPELADQRRQCNRRANTAAAITASLQAITGRHNQRIRLSHPAGELTDVLDANSACSRRRFGRPGSSRLHVLLVAADMLGDKSLVMGAQ